jgi:ATP-dependent phosphoenolpyruvate carboxykinase
MTPQFNLEDHGITVSEIHRNLAPSVLYEHAIRYEKDASIAENGALVAYSGAKTGRSPKDKRVVKHPDSEANVWWGTVNIPITPQSFAINRERARDYLNICDRIYCFDGFAGWDHPVKARVICSRPYHALFMHTMLIRPNKQQLAEFGKPDFVIYNAGAFPANSLTAGMGSKTSIDLSIEDSEMVILGTEYAGEMKKGVFTLVNYLAPKGGILSMHCSATADKHTGRSSLLFGLSGTGKTTLSADPKRNLIGDDIRNAKIPCVAGHPTDVIFLTCDAFGVFPPVSSLSPAQAMYHFISGYTAKVAGTEVGVKEPSATFSACFGGPFMVWHPNKYAELLAAKMEQHATRVWLVNTGWSGGAYGTGKRIKLASTRAIIDAIHSGALVKAKTQRDPVFGFDVVTECPNVPAEILIPRNVWGDKAAFDATAKKLADLFTKNFAAYEGGVSAEVKAAGPVLPG